MKLRPINVFRDLKMKKFYLLILLSVLFVFSSCKDTYYVTKKATYYGKINKIHSYLSGQGFYSIGSNSETKNNVYVSATSYSKYTGYGSKMENDFVTTDTYRFADTLGNTMNYSVSYKLREDAITGISYVEDVEVCGCETSNPKDYENLCGRYSMVRQNINNLPKDQTLEKVNMLNTTLVISAAIIPLTFVVTWLALRSVK